jgi:F0F1-type ATP synthase membrane subunit c/vacuolar-type H+-ATPase subunit K
MWLRLGGALLVTLAALGCLDYFGIWSALSGRSAEDAPQTAHRTRELFWLMIFWVVMATALLAAARRWAGYLRIGKRAC